jgi:hypothetical protein
MIISVTNIMVKIGCRNKFSIRNCLSVVVDPGLCEANDHFIDGNDHLIDEEDRRRDERDGRSHKDGDPDDGDDHFCSEDDHVGCGSDHCHRKDHDIQTPIMIAEANMITSVVKMLFIPPTGAVGETAGAP